MSYINKKIISNLLNKKNFKKKFNLYVFKSIKSTNQFLKKLPYKPILEICCSEQQTNGKGKNNKKWISPFGKNIYLSSKWNLRCKSSLLPGLSLIVGLSIIDSLKFRNIKQNLKIKWPNDIFWKNKKMGGILIENNIKCNNLQKIIIGIGLNINLNPYKYSSKKKFFCSLHEIIKKKYNRNYLIANLLCSLNNNLKLFLKTGFHSFLNKWKKFDFLLGKYIGISQSKKSLFGIYKGINNNGHLILKMNKKIINIASGSIIYSRKINKYYYSKNIIFKRKK
ncbi:biotin--[acetyl-CoA-carboxylase] ligase [Candidatus Legionella polyplacis]|uniref:biotin--[acetyl-CoA-carboxylase] ligase n=1 Tax=Candidatus Legionella polyplacis TaxID=2005262 RepID=UPI000C1F9069|nr:biotin--[acetyl-CoA-carboxylase] ligase [Candidatus Legionella polyplacis]ATW02012.1 biotin--[acetyl-CoA-carboxylase] ligase [Candidatus Legionella polyplacis]